MLFCRPPSDKGILEVMAEFVDYNYKPRQQYRNRLENKAMRLVKRLEIACHNAHILIVYIRCGQLFKHALRWYFSQAHFVFFVLKP